MRNSSTVRRSVPATTSSGRTKFSVEPIAPRSAAYPGRDWVVTTPGAAGSSRATSCHSGRKAISCMRSTTSRPLTSALAPSTPERT
ncbi:hypothetical protein Q760_04080 [Cellulomonas cellasea DSM 20118]|uniref:Uncharacterized protein n=1 Tax=Cellulomonas cellasea DSM 20118 TaxID=1408250 RepID=A0A0A0B992_9CELL|nr:hypothetical protein Q760_04080 [Cellulomonas cellasea DSM 20118]